MKKLKSELEKENIRLVETNEDLLRELHLTQDRFEKKEKELLDNMKLLLSDYLYVDYSSQASWSVVFFAIGRAIERADLVNRDRNDEKEERDMAFSLAVAEITGELHATGKRSRGTLN